MKPPLMYINLPALLLLFVSFSCVSSCNKSYSAAPAPPEITNKVIPEGDSVISKVTEPKKDVLPDDSTLMKFEIIFDQTPVSATASTAPLKYNKSGWTSAEWDDSSPGSLVAHDILKKRFYSDGCGNKVAYTAAVAVNGRKNYNNDEVANFPGNITYEQMKMLIKDGWDIENHSYYHEPNGPFNYGEDRKRNIYELDTLIYKRIGYKMNGHVVPTNYAGFPTAAKEFGYLFSSSQGTHDGLLPAGNPVYKSALDFALAPKSFSAFNRGFFDDWNQMQVEVKASIDELIKKDNQYFRFASHEIDGNAFNNILDYFSSKTNDKYLFISTREIMEYRLMCDLPIKYENINNKMVVSIDIKSVPDRFRWRDLTFLIKSDRKIKGVNLISGIEGYSFNGDTGLVNIFKQARF